MTKNETWHTAVSTWKRKSQVMYPHTGWPHDIDNLNPGDPFPTRRIADRFVETVLTNSGTETPEHRTKTVEGFDMFLALRAGSEQALTKWANTVTDMCVEGPAHFPSLHKLVEQPELLVNALNKISSELQNRGHTPHLFRAYNAARHELSRRQRVSWLSATGPDKGLYEHKQQRRQKSISHNWETMAPFTEQESHRLGKSWVPGVAARMLSHWIVWNRSEHQIPGLLRHWSQQIKTGTVPAELEHSIQETLAEYHRNGLVSNTDIHTVSMTQDPELWDSHRLSFLTATSIYSRELLWSAMPPDWLSTDINTGHKLFESAQDTLLLLLDPTDDREQQLAENDISRIGELIKTNVPDWFSMIVEKEKPNGSATTRNHKPGFSRRNYDPFRVWQDKVLTWLRLGLIYLSAQPSDTNQKQETPNR